MNPFEPAYVTLWRFGELTRRAEQALEHLRACDLCARMCGVDRTVRLGGCRTGRKARVASYGAHHGEEDPLRGWRGSGTIFFSWCNLRCIYCQNHDISQRPAGQEVDAETLSAMMLSLQAQGCHNINLVSPSHVVAQILEALTFAVPAGLRIPLVYNTGGYDSPVSLGLLDGIVDIYMPDMKYSDRLVARELSKIGNYPVMNRAAVKEMHRQVGELEIDDQGIARRGMLVRHLVLPGGLSGTAEVVRFLAEEISPNTYLNLMDQYRPAFKARLHPVLRRGLTSQEFEEALALAHQAGLQRLDRRAPARSLPGF